MNAGPLHLPADLPMIADRVDLGRISAPPLELKPGSVPVWRLKTDLGEFSLKVWLNGESDWLQSYIAGCAEVETAAHRLGVDMVEPIVLNRRLGASIVAVHRWHEGRALQADDDVAAWLGRTMAQLHTISPPASAPTDSLETWYGVHPADDWREWIAQAGEQHLPWAEAAKAALPALRQASELVAEGLSDSICLAMANASFIGIA